MCFKIKFNAGIVAYIYSRQRLKKKHFRHILFKLRQVGVVNQIRPSDSKSDIVIVVRITANLISDSNIIN